MMNNKQSNLFKDTDIRKLHTYHTSVGIASSCFILEPSTEFNEDGQYFIRLMLKTKSKACQELTQLIDNARKKAFDEAMTLLETPRAKKALKLADPSYHEEEDDDGNLTGMTVFNFKRKATRTTRKGEVKPVVIPLFDSVCQPIVGDEREALDLWSGSEISVAFKLVPFYTEKLGVGVSHRIEAVQILKVVSGGDSRTADDFGFERSTGGFVATKSDDDDDDGEDYEDRNVVESFGEGIEEDDSGDY